MKWENGAHADAQVREGWPSGGGERDFGDRVLHLHLGAYGLLSRMVLSSSQTSPAFLTRTG